jgi:hypothetical protein
MTMGARPEEVLARTLNIHDQLSIDLYTML